MLMVTKKALVAEGKTKKIFDVNECSDLVIIESKDRITAHGGVKSHEVAGKAKVANETTARIFEFLRCVGIKSHFLEMNGDESFIARKCKMLPIEFVTRRIATGSFLKRHVNIKEGFRFYPPKIETFFKDDAQNDPEWSFEEVGELTVTLPNGDEKKLRSMSYMDQMLETTRAVFECLEHAWAKQDCVLVDMKIEFGVDVSTGEILLADVIDSDSWRLWPKGDARLMKDKEVYRQMSEVTQEGLDKVMKNFMWVAEKLTHFVPRPNCRVLILMGSDADKKHCEEIRSECLDLGLAPCYMHVVSAHKATEKTLDCIAQYEGDCVPTVVIAVAGMSNGLGPVLSGNTCFPVINCPPPSPQWATADIWSSLRVPSGLGCSTVLNPKTAALQAAEIIGLTDPFIWCKVRGKLLNNKLSVFKANDKMISEEHPPLPAYPFAAQTKV